MDDFWHSISEIADRASRDAGKTVSADDVFNLARQGVIRVGAQIPALDGEDIGELQWHYPDGSQVGQYVAIKIDGMAPWLDTYKLDTLANLGQVTLSGVSWPISGGPTLTAGPDSRYIKRDNLRVPKTEYPRILAAIKGEPETARKIEGTAPTPKRLAAEPGAHLIRQWQDLAERIVKLRESESNIPPSEQEAAIRLRNGFEGERRQLEAKPEFLSALDSYLTRLEATHEGIARSGQQALIEQSAARIESWSEHLARLRMAQAKEHERELELTNDEIDTTGMVAWQVEVLEQWNVITKEYGAKLSPRNVMTWLKKYGHPDRICKGQTLSTASLCWIDQGGDRHSVKQRTIGNVLSDWRREGKIASL
jgi:hypothetical protein